MLNEHICAVDIGSSKIAACVVQIRKKRISNIFFESIPSQGLKKGVVVDSIDLINSIGKVLKNLKYKSGINIKYVYSNISGQDILAKHSSAVIPLAERGNKVITLSDIQKVIEQARILGSSLEEEIIHSLPFSYTIDSKNNIVNPFGLYSHILGVDLYLVCSKLSSIQSLSRVINQAGYELKDLFFSGIATAEIVFSKELTEGVNIICDIGADTTELLIYEDGMLKDIEILSLGGDDLTIQLADTLKIPFDLAEDVKCSYGTIAEYSQIRDEKEILIKKSNIYKPIKQKLVVEIITAKTRLICQDIKNAVGKKAGFHRVNNFITAGRSVLLEGFLEMLENVLETSVKLARVQDADGKTRASGESFLKNNYIRDIIQLANKENLLSGQKYLNYVTCLGIIYKVLKARQPQALPANQLTRNPILKVYNRVKEVYQEYF